MTKAKTCSNCGDPISERSRTGMCKRCYSEVTYANRTPEQKELQSTQQKIRYANRTADEIEANRLYQRVRRAKSTPAQKEERTAKAKIKRTNRTPEQVEADAAKNKKWRDANKEMITAKHKEYYEANKEEMAAKSRIVYDNRTPEQVEADISSRKDYYEANKEEIKAYQVMHRAANPEMIAAQRKVHYEENKEGIAAKSKERYDNRTPEQVKRERDRERARFDARTPAQIDSDRKRERDYRRIYPKERRKYVLPFSDANFIVLNKWFKGAEAHHLECGKGIYIPKDLHKSVRHNIKTGKGMQEINALAMEWLHSGEIPGSKYVQTSLWDIGNTVGAEASI